MGYIYFKISCIWYILNDFKAISNVILPGIHVEFSVINLNRLVSGGGIPGVIPALLGLVHDLAPKVNDEGAKHFFSDGHAWFSTCAFTPPIKWSCIASWLCGKLVKYH